MVFIVFIVALFVGRALRSIKLLGLKMLKLVKEFVSIFFVKKVCC